MGDQRGSERERERESGTGGNLFLKCVLGFYSLRVRELQTIVSLFYDYKGKFQYCINWNLCTDVTDSGDRALLGEGPQFVLKT